MQAGRMPIAALHTRASLRACGIVRVGGKYEDAVPLLREIMKPLVTLVLVASVIIGSLLATVGGALATPFADVPSNHWAYQAIASLAADGLVEGYSDGQFKGDRPLSRYEMAVVVARVIAKIQANGSGYASKTDLDKLQKLIDALKDELDSLGVRVTNVEDALDALDKRTKLAQSLQLHGDLFNNFSERQSVTYPHTLANATGGPVALYYGGTVPAGNSATVDPFVDAFLRSPEDNSPLDSATLANYIRFDDKFDLAYTVNDNLTVSFPIHILNYETGTLTSGASYSIRPDIVIDIARSGNLSNLSLRFGELDNMASSRLGLTYRAPDSAEQGPGFEYPVQNYQTGVQVGGTLDGFTDFQVNFSRVDVALINTQLDVLDSSGQPGLNNYFYYVNRPPTTYVQTGAPGSPAGAQRSDQFTASSGPLGQVFLLQKAQIGTVYVSEYDGSHFNSSGGLVSAPPTGPTAPPGFAYNDNANAVVFSSPLPAGSSVTITYVGLTASNQANPQRYNFNVRLNQKIKGLPGAEFGLSYNRLFDTDDSATPAGITNVGLQNASGYGLISDSVLGLDAQVPLRFLHIGGDRTQSPLLFTEVASSKFSPDYRTVSSVTDAAAVVGLRLKIYGLTAALQFQSVGANYLDGAPVAYYGNAPQLLSDYNQNYFPGFYGFANNRDINARYDAANPACTKSGAGCALANPNLTFIYPVFNPFVASGSQFFSAFAPNTSGVTLTLNAPLKINGFGINARLLGQHLSQIGPGTSATSFYSSTDANGAFATKKRMTLDKIEAGAQFNVPVLKRAIGINLTGGVERLSRADKTAFNYVPVNPGGLGQGGAGFDGVSFYPNYTDMYHTTVAAAASVPLTKDVVFGASYNSQGFRGAYGTTLGQNISQRKDTYVGSITYNIPKTTSSVAFALRNYKYTDFVLPSFNNNENKEDINFVIRF